MGLSDPVTELSGDMISTSLERVYRLDRSFKKIPVYGGGIKILVSQEGKVRTLASDYTKIRSDFNVTPSITSGDAEGIARRDVEEEIRRKGLNPGEFEIITTSQLVVYTIGERELDPVLIWRVNADILYGTRISKSYFIDQGGQIINSFSNIRSMAIPARGFDVLSADRNFTVDKTLMTDMKCLIPPEGGCWNPRN